MFVRGAGPRVPGVPRVQMVAVQEVLEKELLELQPVESF
jgi:hypothetical protein